MNKRSKKIIVAAVIIVAVAATAITVFAYLQSRVDQKNKFDIGEGRAEVTEVFTEPETLSMSNTIEKVVKVMNTGASDQFVRVHLDFSDTRALDKSTIQYTDSGGSPRTRSWRAFLDDPPEGWVYVSESDDPVLGGYFYYTSILEPGEETPALMNGVVTEYAQNDDNTDKITDFDIVVYSETVQTGEIGLSGASATEYKASQWDEAWRSFLALSEP